MMYWWQFLLIEVGVVVLAGLVFLLASFSDVRRYLRIRGM